MLKKCLSVCALTASCILFGVATVRVGFDLYTRSFTREETLILVGVLIVALMVLLIGKVTEAADSSAGVGSTGKSGSAARFSKAMTERMCMTCEYWHGERAPNPRTRDVVARSSKAPGTCMYHGAVRKVARTAGSPPCEAYEPWRLLA